MVQINSIRVTHEIIRHDVLKGHLSLQDVLRIADNVTFVPAYLSDTEIAQCSAFTGLELIITYVLRIPDSVECYIKIHAQILVILGRGDNFSALYYAIHTSEQIALYVRNVVGIGQDLVRRILATDSTPEFTTVSHIQHAHTFKVIGVV